MRVGSLFSGIGGFDLGLERAGFEIAWQVEIDPYCLKVLEKHWPTVRRYGDIRTLTGNELEPVDLLCGGFPCQDISNANPNGQGLAGARSGLWSEFARLIRELKPRWVLVENVPRLLSINDGRDFGVVLADLAACGYDAEWDVLPAAAFGAPHLRERVFIVAYPNRPGGTTRPAAMEARGQRRGRSGRRSREEIPHAQPARLEGDERAVVADTTTRRQDPHPTRSTWWESEPDVGKLADGVPNRVAKLRGLGNALVPQIAEWLGRCILEVENPPSGAGS